MNLLLCVLLVPFVGAFLLLFVPSWNEKLIRRTSLNISLFNFLLSLLLWVQFDNSTGKFQFFQSFGFVELASFTPWIVSLKPGCRGVRSNAKHRFAKHHSCFARVGGE